MDEVLKSRACWILVKILELEKTKDLIFAKMKKEEGKIKSALEANEKNTGLRFLHDIVTGKKTEKKVVKKVDKKVAKKK